MRKFLGVSLAAGALAVLVGVVVAQEQTRQRDVATRGSKVMPFDLE